MEMMKMKEQALIESALQCGAAKAAVIPADRIVLSASFREICRSNGCGNYGRCYMCPPDVGEIETLMEKVRQFPRGLLYQTITPLEDSFDIEGMTAASAEHAQVSQRLQQAAKGLGLQKTLHLTCGGCHLCETCAKRENQPCRFPDKALPSMESYGIDVYQTVRDTPLRYINGQDTVTFFGLLLWED